LLSAINSPNVSTGLPGDLAALLGGGSQTSSLVSMGATLVGNLFGDKAGAVANAIASMAGIKSGSATSLLGLAAPLLFGVLKRYVLDNRLDASGLLNLLGGQGPFLQGKLDDRITGALGLGSVSSFLGRFGGVGAGAVGAARAAGTTVSDTASRADALVRDRGWKYWPWILAGVIALLLLYMLRTCSTTPPPVTRTPEAPPVQAPAATTPPPAAKVYFESAKAEFPGDAEGALAVIIEFARANPASTVIISGFHDATGNRAQNEDLAKRRAFAVRDYLRDKGGIAETRFDMRKPESTTGSGGDREARRVEVSVK